MSLNPDVSLFLVDDVPAKLTKFEVYCFDTENLFLNTILYKGVITFLPVTKVPCFNYNTIDNTQNLFTK